MRVRTIVGDLTRDIRFALRTLGNAPVFTSVAILSLAIGAGAVSAIFSLADALLLRPLPVPRAQELVTIGSTTVQTRFGKVSYPDYVDYRDRLRSFSGVIAYSLTPIAVSEPGSVAQITLGAVVTGNFFAVLGIEPAVGRGFIAAEDRVAGRDAVAVLSYGLWTQRFARDRSVIGRVVRLSGVDFTIVGVAPESFTSLDLGVQPGVFVPVAMWNRLTRADTDPLTDRSARLLTVKGRLADGNTLRSTAAEVAALARALETGHPETNRGVGAIALRERQARIETSPAQATLVPLLGLLSLTVLVVGCANVAGLQLSRNQARRKEMAVRLAMLTIAIVVYLGFRAPLGQSPGFRTSGILLATLDPKLTGLEGTRLVEWYRSLAERLREIGGAESVAFTSELPMRFGQASVDVLPDGYVPTPPAERVSVLASTITPGYFQTIGIPLLRGRAFRDTDDAGSLGVAIVNEAFAATYFPGGDPIGRRITLQGGRALEIVGLAKQSKYTWIAEGPTEFVYLPYAQHPQSRMVVLLRTEGDPAASAGALRAAVRRVDPDLPLIGLTTMSDFYRRQVVGVPLTLIQTIAALGIIGLALTMVGLYGLVSYSVSLKTRELAIRIALGASRERILGSVLRYGALLAAAGILVGCLAALVARRALLGAFPTPTDLPAYILMPVAVVAVTLLAAWLPARRAATLPPTITLRSE